VHAHADDIKQELLSEMIENKNLIYKASNLLQIIMDTNKQNSEILLGIVKENQFETGLKINNQTKEIFGILQNLFKDLKEDLNFQKIDTTMKDRL